MATCYFSGEVLGDGVIAPWWVRHGSGRHRGSWPKNIDVRWSKLLQCHFSVWISPSYLLSCWSWLSYVNFIPDSKYFFLVGDYLKIAAQIIFWLVFPVLTNLFTLLINPGFIAYFHFCFIIYSMSVFPQPVLQTVWQPEKCWTENT